jgi:pimeloyl-ACP methyl ester carboxylesterase
MSTALQHRFIETNGIRMHIAEQGEGPLVILCHGFPEGWYVWRHQMAALADAGYHVVAPDQRGYGSTDCPPQVEDYHILNLTADIVGLVHALGEERATLVGHDWGAVVAWTCAVLRPDVFPALGLLSVPYFGYHWSDPHPTTAMREMVGDKEFYQLYFQEPGKAEAELEADIRKSLAMFFYAASGDAPPEDRWRFVFEKTETLLQTGGHPKTLPAWLTEADLDVFVHAFKTSGFRGGLNWYRNFDRMWELTRFLAGAKIHQPSMFLAGELDVTMAMYHPQYLAMGETMPGLRQSTVLPSVGHWIQQERPAETNAALLSFLGSLSPDQA